MELIDIVRRLNGPIGPIGDSRVDEERYRKLEVMLDLLDALIDDVCAVSRARMARQEYMQKAGEKAHQWLCDLVEGLEEFTSREG